jgi:hypothetical protein
LLQDVLQRRAASDSRRAIRHRETCPIGRDASSSERQTGGKQVFEASWEESIVTRSVIRPIGDGACEIELPNGLVALCDEADAGNLSLFRWFASTTKNSRTFYARGRMAGVGECRSAWHMHRIVLCFPVLHVDHINGNGLDNRRCNLRLCKPSQNACNIPPRENKTSLYRGVYSSGDSWCASIRHRRVLVGLGSFTEERVAAAAYDIASEILHGEFGVRNLSALCVSNSFRSSVAERINKRIKGRSN